MAWRLIKLSIVFCAIVSVKGDYENATAIKKNMYNEALNKISSQKIDKANFDDAFQHYRSDGRRSREPRFISFETRDNNIEVCCFNFKVFLLKIFAILQLLQFYLFFRLKLILPFPSCPYQCDAQSTLYSHF